MTWRETADLPKQYIEQLQFKGYGGHHLGTLECLGLADKDTIRNLTRDFHNTEVNMVVVLFCASFWEMCL